MGLSWCGHCLCGEHELHIPGGTGWVCTCPKKHEEK